MDNEEKKVTLVLRLIRSFEHRTIRNIVYHDISVKVYVFDLIRFIKKDIQTRTSLPPPFRNFPFDTLKIQHKAFGAKTSDPVINTENDEELILSPNKTLEDCNIENETEISFFVLQDYRKYQENPKLDW